jgi:hypothetical protein
MERSETRRREAWAPAVLMQDRLGAPRRRHEADPGVAGDEEQLPVQRCAGAGGGEVPDGEERLPVRLRRQCPHHHPHRQAHTSSSF